jgi:transcription initiation factor TFIIB
VTTGVHPARFAAACLYKAGLEQGRLLSQSDVAEVADISVVTVQTHRDILDELAM